MLSGLDDPACQLGHAEVNEASQRLARPYEGRRAYLIHRRPAPVCFTFSVFLPEPCLGSRIRQPRAGACSTGSGGAACPELVGSSAAVRDDQRAAFFRHHSTARRMPSSYDTLGLHPSSARAFSQEKKHRRPISHTE